MNDPLHFEIISAAAPAARPDAANLTDGGDLTDEGEVWDFVGTDCDCACPAVRTVPDMQHLGPDTLLECHPQQQQLALSPTHTVVFVPSVSRIAVVDGPALQLLQRFGTAQCVDRLAANERLAAQQFYALGLLQAQGVPPAPPRPADELVAWLHVTNACNLRCTYCYIDKTDEAMEAATAFAAIDAVLRSAVQAGYRKVLLKYAGGEASLNLPLVAEMTAYARQQAAAAGIALRGVVLSNGVGLTRPKLQRIHSLGLRLMISLDGPQAFHDQQRPRSGGQGSFQAVVASIERARLLGLTLTVSVTVTGASVDGLPELVRWLLERDIHFTLNFYRECSSGTRAALQLDEERLIAGLRAAYRTIAERLPRYSLLGCLLDRANLSGPHQHACAVGENYLVIDQRGQVARCQMDIARSVNTIWAANPLEQIRRDQSGVQNIPVDAKEGCRTCAWKYWCAGGCALATFRATGRYDIQSPNCAIYHALYPEVIRLEGLRLLHWYGP